MDKPSRVVSYHVIRKVNLGNYESIDISCGVTDSAVPGETIQDALLRIQGDVESVRGQMVQTILEGLHVGHD